MTRSGRAGVSVGLAVLQSGLILALALQVQPLADALTDVLALAPASAVAVIFSMCAAVFQSALLLACGYIFGCATWMAIAAEPPAAVAPAAEAVLPVVAAPPSVPLSSAVQLPPAPAGEPPSTPAAWAAERSWEASGGVSLAPLSPPATATRKTYVPLVHTFNVPVERLWETALQGKYAPPRDPLNPGVLSVEWQPASATAAAASASAAATVAAPAAVCRRRVVTFDTTAVPYMLRRMSGIGDRLLVEEEFEWRPAARTVLARVANISETALASFLELAVFEPCPTAPHAATRYTSWVEVASDTAAGRSLLRLLPGEPAALLAKHIETLAARALELPQPRAAAAS